jgi:hypothetical protein
VCNNEGDALGWYGMTRWGKWNEDIPIPIPCLNHVSDSMPCRGIAYQPTVQTLGIDPEKQTRVLKEGRIAAGLGTSFWEVTGFAEADSELLS